MDTTHGEPGWVNWSQKQWAIEEMMQDVSQVGEMINAHVDKIQEMLPSHEEAWAKHYDKLNEAEMLSHELLQFIERIKYLGLGR